MAWNPYFDWCSILLSPKPIPPKQRKSGTKNREFENIISEMQSEVVDRTWYPMNQWPWKEKLFVMLAFSGPKGYIENCDIDNLSKAALDAYKGIVYVDDKQIYHLMAYKSDKPIKWVKKNTPALIIGIKKIDTNFELVGVPQFFIKSKTGGKKDSPAQLSFKANGKILRFDFPNGMTGEDFERANKEIMKEVKKLTNSRKSVSSSNRLDSPSATQDIDHN